MEGRSSERRTHPLTTSPTLSRGALLASDPLRAARTTLEALINDAIEQQRFRPINASTAAQAVLALVLHFTGPEHAQATSVSPATALALVFDIFIAGAESRR
jgi:hypothetical protein